MAKSDLVPTILKGVACLLLFIGMMMVSLEDMESTKNRSDSTSVGFIPLFTTSLSSSYVVSYICLAVAIIVLEVGNIVICAKKEIEKMGDAIWQAINAFLAFCVALMWCVVVNHWRKDVMPTACPGSNCPVSSTTSYLILYMMHWVAMIFAFVAGALFTVAAVLNMKARRKVANDDAEPGMRMGQQPPQSQGPPPPRPSNAEGPKPMPTPATAPPGSKPTPAPATAPPGAKPTPAPAAGPPGSKPTPAPAPPGAKPTPAPAAPGAKPTPAPATAPPGAKPK